MANRQAIIPSKHFINTFMCSFAEDPVFNLLKQDDRQLEGSDHLSQALDSLKEKDYDSIIELCTKELESEKVKANRLLLVF